MEVEAKFRVPDAALLERLAAAARLVGYDLEASVARSDEDVFLDTADGKLLAAGFYLRRRQNADGVRFALKEIAAAHDDGVLRREEHELRAAADVPVPEWPRGPLRRRVHGIVGDEELVPLLKLEQQRRTRRVGLEGRAVAELSLDVVAARAGSRARRWYEVELELLPGGTEDDLVVLREALRDVWGLVPETRSKFERALEADAASRVVEDAHGAPVDAPPAPAVTPLPEAATADRKGPRIALGDPMAAAAVAVMRLHLEKMLRHESGTIAGDDPEELHDMRVATRRLRMALRLFAGHLDGEKMRPVLKGLRQTGRALGAVRDLDVFREKTQGYVERLPAARRAELDPLLAALRTEYDARRAEMVAHLQGSPYRSFVERAGALLAGPPAALAAPGGLVDARVREALPSLLCDDLAAVLVAGGLIVGPSAPLAHFHQLRIAGKALRYTLEFFEGPLGDGAEPLIETMKGLQDHLGDLQDAVVSCGIVRDVLTWGSWTPASTSPPVHTDIVVAPGLARYLVARQEEMERLVTTFPDAWAGFAGGEVGARLTELLARL